MGFNFRRHQPVPRLVDELHRIRHIVGADGEVADGVEDAKHGDLDRIVCEGIDCESGGMETVMFKWDHKILSEVPFLVELVIYGEPGWVQNAAHVKSK